MKNGIKGTFLLRLLILILSASILIGSILLIFGRNVFLSPTAFALIVIAILIMWFFVESGIAVDLLLIVLQNKIKIEMMQKNKWLRIFFYEEK